MSTPTKPTDSNTPKSLSVNVDARIVEDVDALVAHHSPFVRRHAVHLAALRVGLAELRAHPERLPELLANEQDRRASRA